MAKEISSLIINHWWIYKEANPNLVWSNAYSIYVTLLNTQLLLKAAEIYFLVER